MLEKKTKTPKKPENIFKGPKEKSINLEFKTKSSKIFQKNKRENLSLIDLYYQSVSSVTQSCPTL